MTADVAFQTYMENACIAVLGNDRAYTVTSVPTDAVLPYMTYEWTVADITDGDVPIVVQIWERTTSELIPNKHAADFRKYIETNDTVTFTDGAIWLKPGNPWCRSLKDEVSKFIKRRYMNVTLEFLTR